MSDIFQKSLNKCTYTYMHRYLYSFPVSKKYLQVTSSTGMGHSVEGQVPSDLKRLFVGLITLFIKSSDPKLLHNTGTKSDNQPQLNKKTDPETMLRVFCLWIFLKAPTNMQGIILFPEMSLGA